MEQINFIELSWCSIVPGVDYMLHMEINIGIYEFKTPVQLFNLYLIQVDEYLG